MPLLLCLSSSLTFNFNCSLCHSRLIHTIRSLFSILETLEKLCVNFFVDFRRRTPSLSSSQSFVVISCLFMLFFFNSLAFFSDDFSPAMRSTPSPRHGIKSNSLSDGVHSMEGMAVFESVMPMEYERLHIGLRLEKMFEDAFKKWGIFVASNPYPVMIGAFIVSFILAMGMCYWKVTTDPVDLWVSPTSQARQDMEFFNKNFWKFYRIEQVVISPSKNSRVYSSHAFNYTYQKSDGSRKSASFGPAFNQSFLLKVFNLQKRLESLEVSNSRGVKITLDSICFKPLDKDCATQSIFTYFLDDVDLIQSANYAERIEVCTR